MVTKGDKAFSRVLVSSVVTRSAIILTGSLGSAFMFLSFSAACFVTRFVAFITLRRSRMRLPKLPFYHDI